MLQLDIQVNAFFAENITSTGLVIMNIVTDILNPKFLSVVLLIGIIYFIFRKKWRYAVITAASLVGGLAIITLLKEIVARARPIGGLIIETDFSFPSGHAVMATIFFVLAIYIFAPKIQSAIWRKLFIALCVLLTVLAGVSRLYLGVHWFSDILAGICIGFLWVMLVVFLIKKVSLRYNQAL